MTQTSISVILTHFNKGPLLQRTIESLQPDLTELLEIIVVDDCSTDPDWPDFAKFLEEKYFPKIKIIYNSENKGPATRLNQGGSIAKGEYIFFMDADDIAAPNLILNTINLIKNNNYPDLIYGRVNKIKNEKEITHLGCENISFNYIKNPIEFIIKENILHMCVFCKNNIFQKSGGCFDNLFIQDEALALNLGIVSKTMLYIQTPSVYILDSEVDKVSHLSSNKYRQHKDTFLSIYLFKKKQHILDENLNNILIKKATSMYFKSKKEKKLLSFLDYIDYFDSKIRPSSSWKRSHKKYYHYFILK